MAVVISSNENATAPVLKLGWLTAGAAVSAYNLANHGMKVTTTTTGTCGAGPNISSVTAEQAGATVRTLRTAHER